MSFILEALRKAERDRSLGQAPRIEDVALARDAIAAGGPEAARPSLLLMLAALALLVISLISFFTFRKTPPMPTAAPAAVAGVVTATVRGPAPSPVKASIPDDAPRAVEAPPAISPDQPITSLDDLAENTPPTPAPLAATTRRDETSPPVKDFIARPASRPTPEPPSTTTLEPLDLGSAAPVVEESATSSAAAAATPLQNMPAAYRASFPAFAIDVHAWDTDPSHRFVLISGVRYHEGDTLAEGPHVVEITQDGVVMSFGGSTVLYSIQD